MPPTPPSSSPSRTTCLICGRPVAMDRINNDEMPPTCGDPECDHRSLGVDILLVAKRVGTSRHPPPSLIGDL